MKAVTVDLASEADFDAATSTLQKHHPEFRPNVIINATGLLHDINGDHGTPLRPETSIKQLSSATFEGFLTQMYWGISLLCGIS